MRRSQTAGSMKIVSPNHSLKDIRRSFTSNSNEDCFVWNEPSRWESSFPVPSGQRTGSDGHRCLCVEWQFRVPCLTAVLSGGAGSASFSWGTSMLMCDIWRGVLERNSLWSESELHCVVELLCSHISPIMNIMFKHECAQLHLASGHFTASGHLIQMMGC